VLRLRLLAGRVRDRIRRQAKPDPGRDVPRAEPAKLAAAFGLDKLDKEAFIVIWTTTAWTIPANQALNVNPELEYAWWRPSAAC
jgi:hypothetical protein